MQIFLYQQAIKRLLLFAALISFSTVFIKLHSSNFPLIGDIKVTLKITDQPVKKVFNEINKQTGLYFLYNENVLSGIKNVTLNANNEPLNKVLDELSKQTKLSFKQTDNTISVKRIDDNSSTKSSSANQQKPISITGQVKDFEGESLIGVNVAVKGTTSGTMTDIDGRYMLEVTSEEAELVFSFVGFVTHTEKVGKRRQINITMQEKVSELEEVVVVAYGVQKKVNVTGAVSSVSGDVLESRPIASAGGGLQGLLPGVTITSSSGQPGSPGINIVVRGVNTINSSTGPLILIDGVAGGDINLLNPDDIENVSVLKDAASSAIYGARAANGVILVTTKSGKNKEKSTLSYSGYFGIQTPTSMPELVNGRQYMTLENEARAARGVAIPYSSDAFMKYDSKNFPNEYSNTDWIDEVFKKTSIQHSHNLSINGSSDKASYYMSYGHLNQTGLVVGDLYESKRNNVRMKVNTTVFDRLKVDGNLSFVDYYRQDAGASGTAGVFRLVQRTSPLLPVKWQLPTEDGGWYDSPYWSYGSVSNPVYTAYDSGYTKSKSRSFSGILNASLNIIHGLDVNAQYSFEYYNNETKSWSPTMPKFLADGTPHTANEDLRNRISESRKSILTQTTTITANYLKKIDKHEIKLLGGFSQEWATIPTLSASRKNILLDGLEVIDVGTEDFLNAGKTDEWALRSYFGRLNYNFDEKYLFEANIRRDGTSRFAKDHRWGTFPSFSVGWKFSEESFMEFTKPLLVMGKLRGSWGELGNQNISSDYYHYITAIERQVNSYPIGGKANVGFKQSKLNNDKIQWETLRMLNFGADFLLLNNRLDISFDWFKKDNKNALLKPAGWTTVIGVSGAGNLPFLNTASIENKGFEIAVSWKDQIGEVKYSLTANLSDAKNKVTDLGSDDSKPTNPLRQVGFPLNAYYGYLTEGLAQVSDFESYDADKKRYVNPKFPVISSYADIIQPGDIKYRDISGPDGVPDGVIDDHDWAEFGNPYPRYTFSLRGTAAWKSFDFSFYLQGVGKVNGYLSDEARHAFINDYSIPKTAHLDRWTPNNPDASYPRLYYGQTHNLVFSDYWVEDASYIRLKNIQMGYTIPRSLTQKVMISRARIYVSIDNLVTLSKYFGGFDPEVRETSGDNYPQVKTFAFGVNVTF